ncbi:RagB/SusD family nutrient uptake outer membrane protein [Labilibaculum euxinus]
MKKNIYIKGLCAVILFLGILTSCTELLDDSYGNVIGSQYSPETDADISFLVNAAYVPWRETMLLWNGVVRGQQNCGDQDVTPARPNGWVDGGIYKRWHQHTWTVEDNSVWEPWNRTYNGVTTCNRLLSQIDDGSIGVEGETKINLISELKVLRASYYYILVDFYGNVPIVTDYRNVELPQQSSRVEVFNFIVKEITDNIDNLSEESRGYFYGRINKWAAYTFLSKIYLNAEVWTGNEHWDDCIDACDKVIAFAENSGEYALEENQKNVFITENENSKEIIYALPEDEVYVEDWNAFDFHLNTLASENQKTYNFTNAPWGGVCAIPQFIDSFDPEDIRLKENYIFGQQYWYSGDTLYRSDNGEPMVYVNSVPSIDESSMYDGYRWGKFEYAIGSTNRLSNDWPLLRYADVLMMKAESLMRSGKAGAGELVTKVRTRAFKNNPAKATVTDAELEAGSVYDYGRRDSYKTTHEGGADIQYGRFLDELGWEFCQEGRRRQDMIRFGAFTTKSWFSHDVSTSSANRAIYPIPNQALLTNSNLSQNPGY